MACSDPELMARPHLEAGRLHLVLPSAAAAAARGVSAQPASEQQDAGIRD
jgi:hypothetical protein